MTLQNPPNPFRDKMARGETAYGTFVFARDPSVTEIVGSAGFDLAIIDTEHAVLGMPEVVDHLRAAQCAGISAWVRVGDYDPAAVGRILDAGAQGIVFPHYGLAPAQAAEGLSALRPHRHPSDLYRHSRQRLRQQSVRRLCETLEPGGRDDRPGRRCIGH